MPAEPDGSGPMIQTRKELGEYKRLKSKDLQEDKLNQGEITPEQVCNPQLVSAALRFSGVSVGSQ